MILSDHLNALRDSRQIKPTTVARYRYELAIWSRCGGPLLTGNVSSAVVQRWRQHAADFGLTPRTIESVIQSVSKLAKMANVSVDIGHKLRHVPQPPDCPSLESLDAVLRQIRIGDPFRLWLAVGYVTGFRLADLMTVTREDVSTGFVSRSATKTSKPQPTAVPACLVRIADEMTRRGRLSPASPRTIRTRLDRLCLQAGVPRFTPQQLRVLSATEWERARPGCGAVVLGHALPGWSAATYYYLRASEMLRLGLPNLRLPQSLLTDEEIAARESGEQHLLETFRGLPDEQRASLVTVASAMAK